MATTETLKYAGYDAAGRGDYLEAARLYDEAADSHPKTGKGARVTVAKLRATAQTYRKAAEYRAAQQELTP